MRSLLAPIIQRPERELARLANLAPGEAPVPYTSKIAVPALFGRTDREAQLRAFGKEPVLFACVTRLATAMSSLEWGLHDVRRGRAEADRVEIGSHAFLDLWRDPNPIQTAEEFVETFDQHLELTGETYLVLGMPDRGPQIPLSIWPVRPDRMAPVPDSQRFRNGFIYTDPDGQKVPFPEEQVIHIKYPDPHDPYYGLGPVRALMTDIDGATAAATYNSSFFHKSAEPGGVVQVDRILSDQQFDKLSARWNEQHRGYANAHRVAILEAGMQWVPRAFTNRDMQFVELREASDAHIMLAYGMSKVLLGQTENVNRATAYAAEYIFAKWQIVPRARRIRGVINKRLLRPYYARGSELFADFTSPVEADAEIENAERQSKVGAARDLIELGADPAETLAAFDLPELAFTSVVEPVEPDPIVAELGAIIRREIRHAQAVTVVTPPERSFDLEPAHRHDHGHRALPARAQTEPDLDPADIPDLAELEERHATLLAALLARWADIEDAQKAELVATIAAIARDGTFADLARLDVDIDDATDVLADAMEQAHVDGAETMSAEAAEQGVTIEPAAPDRTMIAGVAAVVAGMIAGRLITSAKNTALRVNSTTTDANEIAAAVQDGLAGLSTAGPGPMLSGALTGAQNDGRIAVLRRGPVAAIYSNEVNDRNTCGPCRRLNGKWLGNWPEDQAQILDLYPGGAYGGFVDCEGRERCRGTITGVWRRSVDDR